MLDQAAREGLVEALKTLEATLPKTEDQAISEKRDTALVSVYHWVLLKAYALLRVESRHREDAAHEIAQTILFERLSNQTTLRRVIEARSPRAFLQTAIQNLIYETYRKKQNRWEAGFSPLANAAHFQDRRDARDVVDTADAIAFLWQHMTDEEKDLVHLRYWEDLSLKETSERLGITYHAAAKRDQRLMAKLRAVLQPAES